MRCHSVAPCFTAAWPFPCLWLPTTPYRRAAETTSKLRQGAASGEAMVDCGAMCMPGAAEKVQQLIDDAVEKGAQVRGNGLVAVWRVRG